MNIFFDFDGTLLDVSKKYHLAHSLAAKKNAIKPLSFKKYWSLKRKKTPEYKIVKIAPGSKTYKLYEEERMGLLENKNILVKDRLLPAVSKLLKKLKKNHKLYLITLRRNRLGLKDQLNRFGIGIYFNKILSAPPAKDPIKTKTSLLKKIGFKSEDINIGDTETDVLVAKKLGIKSVAVYSGIRTKKLLRGYKPDFLIKNIFQFEYINK